MGFRKGLTIMPVGLVPCIGTNGICIPSVSDPSFVFEQSTKQQADIRGSQASCGWARHEDESAAKKKGLYGKSPATPSESLRASSYEIHVPAFGDIGVTSQGAWLAMRESLAFPQHNIGGGKALTWASISFTRFRSVYQNKKVQMVRSSSPPITPPTIAAVGTGVSATAAGGAVVPDAFFREMPPYLEKLEVLKQSNPFPSTKDVSGFASPMISFVVVSNWCTYGDVRFMTQRESASCAASHSKDFHLIGFRTCRRNPIDPLQADRYRHSKRERRFEVGKTGRLLHLLPLGLAVTDRRDRCRLRCCACCSS